MSKSILSLAGMLVIDDLIADMEAAGFSDISIQPKDSSREFIKDWAPGLGVEDYVISASIEGRNPSAC